MTTLAPQSGVSCSGVSGHYDVDWTDQQAAELLTGPTAAAITSRSHQAGVVTVTVMHDSVRSASEPISVGTWRAMSPRAADESAASH